jgi:hypothetical protein
MPLVGSLDIALGFLMLIVPLPIAGWWMLAWATWTAILRPLAGEPVWEAFERGGNYGAPAAILLLMLHSHEWRGLVRPGFREMTPAIARRLDYALRVAVIFLLVGHGALGVIGKPGLVANLSSVMAPETAAWLTPRFGWFEIFLGIVVAVRPAPWLLLFVALWKIGTESLFVTAGAPIWETIERGGSYCAPLALAVVRTWRTSRNWVAVPPGVDPYYRDDDVPFRLATVFRRADGALSGAADSHRAE